MSPVRRNRSEPRALRLALLTWTRRDRRACGEVVLATALDLIDAGSSPVREARGLVRSGLGLRWRGLGRDVAAAPWREGARMALILAGVLLATLIVTAHGGWGALLGGGVAGLEVPGSSRLRGTQWTPSVLATVLTSLVVALLALRGRLGAATVGTLVVAGMLVGLRAVGDGLGTPLLVAGDIGAQAGADLDGIAGLMLAVAALAGASVTVPRNARSRARVALPGRGRTTAAVMAAVACLVAAPAAAALLQELLMPERGMWAEAMAAGLEQDAVGAYLLAGFVVVLPLLAVSLTRAAPRFALGAALMSVPMIVPVAWNALTPLAALGLSPPWLFSGAPSIFAALAIWAACGAIGLLAFARTTAAIGAGLRADREATDDAAGEPSEVPAGPAHG